MMNVHEVTEMSRRHCHRRFHSVDNLFLSLSLFHFDFCFAVITNISHDDHGIHHNTFFFAVNTVLVITIVIVLLHECIGIHSLHITTLL